jgi:hypothetical protein
MSGSKFDWKAFQEDLAKAEHARLMELAKQLVAEVQAGQLSREQAEAPARARLNRVGRQAGCGKASRSFKRFVKHLGAFVT